MTCMQPNVLPDCAQPGARGCLIVRSLTPPPFVCRPFYEPPPRATLPDLDGAKLAGRRPTDGGKSRSELLFRKICLLEERGSGSSAAFALVSPQEVPEKCEGKKNAVVGQFKRPLN